MATLTSLDLYITARCGRRCTYCFLPAAYLDSAQVMPLSMATGAIAWAARSNVEEITVLGGEPSSSPDFVAILDAIAAAGLAARVVTNGSSRMRALLQSGAVSPANVRRVAVSLDTVDAAAQDRLRGRGAHRDAVATIDLLRAAGIALDINVTATTTAVEGIWDLLRYAEAAGCRRVNVHWPSAIGIGAGLQAEEIPAPDLWQSLVRDIQTFRPTRSGFFVEIERAFLQLGEPFARCALIDETNLQVMPDGRAYRCGLLVDDPTMAALRFVDSDLALANVHAGEEALRRVAHDCTTCPALVATPERSRRACIYDKVASVQH